MPKFLPLLGSGGAKTSLLDEVVRADTDPAALAGYVDHPPRMGFFTDTSVCIGCKACEVACKQWNDVPEDGITLSGMSYDNTRARGADTWRHVAFVEKPVHPTTTDLGLPGMGP